MGEIFFVVGLLMGGIICAGFTSAVAVSKNRSGLGWFILGVPFGPLALFAVGVMPALDD